jgi:ligand-binding sensor domain-containing protein
MKLPMNMIPLLAAAVLLSGACNGQRPAGTQAGAAAPQLSDYVVNVFEDSKGRLWFSTIGDGVARYDPAAAHKQGQGALTFLSEQEGLVGSTATDMAEDSAGNLWIGTHSGLSRYDGKAFTNYTEADGLGNERVSQVHIDRSGTLWVGTWGGVCRYDGTRFVRFELPVPDVEVPTYQATANWVSTIMEDSRGNIWIGRSGYGACRYEPSTGRFTQFTKKEGLSSNCVQTIVEDARGHIWFGFRVAEHDHPDATARHGVGGVSRFDGHTFNSFAEMEGLHTTDVYTIYQDRAGTMWIGATNMGVYRYDGTRFLLTDTTDRMDLTRNFGLQDALQDSRGTLWFGMSGGLFKWNGTSIVNVTRSGPWE